jgi:argininosuccinate lyase
MSRFSEPQHPDFQAINTSLAFDRRLWPYDIAQSRAHAAMLASIGVIEHAERDELLAGLEAVSAELAAGRFAFLPDDEDIHMAIERRLTEIVGRVGGKLHTARSRNDQVATDVALFVREAAGAAHAALGALIEVLLARAEEHLDWPMPGYTHLQRAQPVYLGHHLLAYVWMFLRDRGRFEAVIEAAGVLPLGVGALAGVNFATDRERLADELGFASIAANSIDAVSNRDFALDYLAAAATAATHLSRLGAELVLWSSEEFGFCALSDAWSSGSSIMPQKKNPDAAELLRAKAPRILAHHAALHGVLHGLPLTYSKDMQEDKEHLFDAVDTLALSLAAARGMLATITFKRERLAQAASDELIAAVDLADLLVRRGVPFREAHGMVADLVRVAVADGRSLSSFSDSELAELAPAIDASALRALLQGDSWLESKVSAGGTALVRVREQLAAARAALAGT